MLPALTASITDPPELEVLRLTSGVRPAHQFVVLGFISALVFAALAMVLILFTGKSPKVGLTVLAIGETLAAACFLYGMSRLHRTLNPNKIAADEITFDEPQLLRSAATSALPPHVSRGSITEGTTELLVPRESERVAVPLKAREADTAEIG